MRLVFKITFILIALFLSLSAFAIDTELCPQQISLKVDVLRVYKSSKYEDVQGWKEAQSTLQAVEKPLESQLLLIVNKSGKCQYNDSNTGSEAVLRTEYFEHSDMEFDQLTINLKVDESIFAINLPIASYGLKGLEPRYVPFQAKIKTILLGTRKYAEVLDIGMASVTAK